MLYAEVRIPQDTVMDLLYQAQPRPGKSESQHMHGERWAKRESLSVVQDPTGANRGDSGARSDILFYSRIMMRTPMSPAFLKARSAIGSDTTFG